jgi:hypothetical protein
MVLEIAHQEEGRLFLCVPEIIPRSTSFLKKILMASCRASIPLPFPPPLRRLVPRRPPRRADG